MSLKPDEKLVTETEIRCGTLLERYTIYIENTNDECPLTFDEWLNN